MEKNNIEKEPPRYLQEPVAVIGLACRLPGDCNNPTALWEFLERGGIAHNEAPPTRFNLKTHHDDYRKPKTMRSPGGMFLENIDPQDFDAQFFGISGVDAMAMDPQQRQLLEVVYECLENAGQTLEGLDGKPVGCFVGSFAVDYADMAARDPEDRPPTITVGAGRAILSNRISHFLNIKGPSMTIDTACSGALVSVDLACRYLNSREIAGAIVAASNIYLSPEHVMDEGSMRGVASTSGKCHTFDVKADGYIKAEAVNAVMLKRLDDALRDGDPIRAIIRGSATNSDGRTPGIASPSSEAQAAAIRAAYANAGISDISATAYVECHGTGTQAGDPIEVNGVASVFSPHHSPDNPLIIGSIKSNIGHSEPAAGISGLIKAILSIEKGLIPRNPTFKTPSPKIEFDALKLRVPKSTISWPVAPFRRASINSFGYGGSNAHVIIDNDLRIHTQKPQLAQHRHTSSITSDWELLFAEEKLTQPQLIVFSANDAKSLNSYCKTICEHLSNPSVAVKLPDLAYTLSERRSRHFHRAYVVTDNTNINEGAFTFGKKNTNAPRIGFVFTGQGAQWSQMGKGVIETFPIAKALINRLDRVLQALPKPPSWSLLNELTESRGAEHLRLPEFSQPLVTALQLAILAVLETWGVFPEAVVGHSSGEIAAAYAAGHLTAEEAIKVAYFRGQACTTSQDSVALGMLAAGLGAAEIKGYLDADSQLVQIGCFNSPSSVTLSGDRAELERIRDRLVEDGHFARMLLVNFAYHSQFMAEPAVSYEEMLRQNCGAPSAGKQNIRMFSSVTGKLLDRDCNADYWKTNMTSPVRFGEAVGEMVAGQDGAECLIEIGPSGALAGPVGQIMKSLGSKGSNVQYSSALARGNDSIKSLFGVAGRLFVAGSPVALAKVNQAQDSAAEAPSLIVDLPNYKWNHSTKYWHESESSKDWRFRKFPHHDLLGSKILGTSWNAPSWKKTLRVENLHWLKDHRMGEDIVFPAAGFITMAVEALYQARQATDPIDENILAEKYRYRLRNSTFPKALVLQENGLGTKIMLTLAKQQNSWYEFTVSSLTGETWSEHSKGLIRLEEATRTIAPESALTPLEHTTPGSMWYKAMNDAGYNFGPVFQKHLAVETRSGVRKARSKLSLTPPEEEYRQSSHPMHPVNVDGCLQTVSLALFRGNRSDVDAVLIPAIIDSIVIIPTALPETGIAVTSSKYEGIGRREASKNYMSDVSVYDPSSKNLLFEVKGIHYHQLDVIDLQHTNDSYCEMTWKPDITHLTQESFYHLSREKQDGYFKGNASMWNPVNELIDMVAHKKPSLKVMEVNISSDDQTSIWLDEGDFDETSRAASKEYHFVAPDATVLMNVQEKYTGQGNAKFSVLDVTRPPVELSPGTEEYDLIIVKTTSLPEGELANVLQNLKSQLSQGGHMLLVENTSSVATSESEGVFVSGKSGDDSSDTAMTSEDGVFVHEDNAYDEPIPDDVSPKLAEVLITVDNIESANVAEVAVEQIGAVEQLEVAREFPSSTIAEEPATGAIEQLDFAGEVTSSTIAKEPATEERTAESSASAEEPSILTLKEPATEEKKTESSASTEEPSVSTLEEPTTEEKITESSASAEEPFILTLEEPLTMETQSEDLETSPSLQHEDIMDSKLLDLFFSMNGYNSTLRTHNLTLLTAKARPTSLSPQHLNLVQLSPPTDTTTTIKSGLQKLRWKIEDHGHTYPFPNLLPKSTVLIIDELSSPVLAKVDEQQWEAIKDLAAQEHKILWVTTGSQLHVAKPDNALIHGLARTMRAEDPLLNLVILDVESSTGSETVGRISQVLKEMGSSSGELETELVERGGVMYSSRVRAGEKINPVEKKDDGELEVLDLQESKTLIKLQCERVGTLDSLRWTEIAGTDGPVQDDMVEIEIVAAGLNFKDIAVSMGIVPENEYLLGLEGAGVVRRIGKDVHSSSLQIGRRVLLHNKGTFANRLQVYPEKCHVLPDEMSFEDAATMPSVYLVTIHSLLHLANMQKGQRVLIHSATGGVGIAAIQLCQYVGAEIFATVGTPAKREFLTSTFSIPSTHIFSSRTSDFGSQILDLTNGEGVDVVLNSLTGDLLDESWRIMADGGTFLEIGKKDMLARNALSMEPFNRNVSYHGVDMSHKQISNSMIAALLAEMMDLYSKGAIKPISPITVFTFEEIVDAFVFLRGGNHLGKVVISNSSTTTQNIKVPVRLASKGVSLRQDASYLIVGGLKGLCGSLAIYLARLGAKHLTILCRSGYEDQKSRAILANVYAEGCKASLFTGDVSKLEDVERVFREASLPIRGVIQGAMVLRDKIYSSMTSQEYHTCITSKVLGTWNLHISSLPYELDFFTLLSSISGVIGQKGQANYAAANSFLDSFSAYRQSLNLPASSIDLGVIEDVGYVAERDDLAASFDKNILTPINERQLHKILHHSISLQKEGGGGGQLITGLVTPQQETSPLLLTDTRFTPLAISSSTNSPGSSSPDNSKPTRAFFLLLASQAEPAVILSSAIELVAAQFSHTLRLAEPVEPGKPLTSYGLDSLAAVEFRNWLRAEMGAVFTMLEVMGATSLVALCESLVEKVRANVLEAAGASA